MQNIMDPKILQRLGGTGNLMNMMKQMQKEGGMDQMKDVLATMK